VKSFEGTKYLRRLENGSYTYQYVNIIFGGKRYFYFEASAPDLYTLYEADIMIERLIKGGLTIDYLIQRKPYFVWESAKPDGLFIHFVNGTNKIVLRNSTSG